MRTNIIHKIKLSNLLVLFTLIALTWACESDDDFSAEGETRMFTPGEISVQSYEDRAELTWDASLFTSGIQEIYTAQVAEDSLFTTPSEIVVEKQTDTSGVIFTDQELEVRQQYYVRVKVAALADRPESKWSVSRGFSIRGVQKLYPVLSPSILATSVKVNWEITAGVTEFKLQEYTQDETDPTAEKVLVGDPFSIEISDDEAQNGSKVIENLDPDTKYNIDLYKGPVSIGYRSFKTKEESDYAAILTPADDIVTIVNNSQDGDVIGLEPGVYETGGSSFFIDGKTIVIESISNDPNDTKINFKEFTLNNSGAGITLRGLELDGTDAGALYLINLTSGNGNGDTAAFTDVFIDNCKIHDVATSAFRANRGSDGAYSMNTFNIDYSTFYDFAPGNYAFLHAEELVVNEVNLSNSTFYRTGDLFIRYRKEVSASPVFNINYCTINSIGFADNYTLLDVNDVQFSFNFKNNILANIPRPGGTAREDLIRMSNATSSASFTFNNFFNLTNGDVDDPQPVTIPEQSFITQENIFNVDLGWDDSTTDFTLPSDSELQNASSTGGAIGDPKWWF
ncbi:DUF4957 domain-containing protein [Mesonia aestuariivivens]|uniref:DUF4957 domain-containing protein n=1 Tax=Mesonia aestuariivivens TaxID=2796128 RepID=A0ABS6W3S7_9FLAO|nr:DUF4957 domain-containing protein [Mesonia aestuariivivens]MBW2961768.1 DUF4957 domain-containing protein [Mesonia aestuariivivens]